MISESRSACLTTSSEDADSLHPLLSINVGRHIRYREILQLARATARLTLEPATSFTGTAVGLRTTDGAR